MRKILVLRSGGAERPEGLEGDPDLVLLSTLEIVPVPAGIEEALAFDARGARLVISSKTTVEIFLESKTGAALFRAPFLEVLVAGEGTADFLRRVIAEPARLTVPRVPGAAGVLHLLRRTSGGLSGLRVLWPRGSDAAMEPVGQLRRGGAKVAAPVVYEKRPRASLEEDTLREFQAGRFAAVAVGSLAALDVFLDALGRAGGVRPLLPQVRWGALGPETAKAFSARGLPPPLVPPRPRFVDLIELLKKDGPP